ncbi:MAG: hypothetical protein ACXAB7_01935 [Candidatus Kariarchaeaceae archaeon]|jgi:hypothetical protein
MREVRTIISQPPQSLPETPYNLEHLFHDINDEYIDEFQRETSDLSAFIINLFGPMKKTIDEIAEQFFDVTHEHWKYLLIPKTMNLHDVFNKYQYQQVILSNNVAKRNLYNRRLMNTLFLLIMTTQTEVNPVPAMVAIPCLVILQRRYLDGFSDDRDNIYLFDQHWGIASLLEKQDQERFFQFISWISLFSDKEIESYLKQIRDTSLSNPHIGLRELFFVTNALIPNLSTSNHNSFDRIISTNLRVERPQSLPKTIHPFSKMDIPLYSIAPVSLNKFRYVKSGDPVEESSPLIWYPLLYSNNNSMRIPVFAYSHVNNRYKGDLKTGVDIIRTGLINCISNYSSFAPKMISHDQVNLEKHDPIHLHLMNLKNQHPPRVTTIYLQSKITLSEMNIEDLIRYFTDQVRQNYIDIFSLKVWSTFAMIWVSSFSRLKIDQSIFDRLPSEEMEIRIE